MNARKNEAEPRKRSLRRRVLKVVLVALGTVLALLVAAVLIGPALVSTSAVERVISDSTQESLGRPAKLGEFSMSLIGGVRVTLSDLVIEDSEEYGERPFVKVDKITLDANLLSLLTRQAVVNKMTIENPQLSIVQGKHGRFNFNDLPVKRREPGKEEGPKPVSAAAYPSLKLSSFELTNGTIHFTNLETDEASRISNLNAELVAEVRPPDRAGEITKAKLRFDGFDFSARGKVGEEDGKPVVKNVAVDSKADISKVGESMSAVLPVKLSGAMEYHLSADGPITAVGTKSEMGLTDFQATGALLRKPAGISDLVLRQSSVLNLEAMSAEAIASEVLSAGLGVKSTVTGRIGNVAEPSGLDLKIEGEIDLDKLSDFANALTPQPLTAKGLLTAESIIVGDPATDLTAKGRVLIGDFRLESPRMAEPYSEARIDLNYDLTAREHAKLNIRKLQLTSRLITAEASGNVSADAADLVALTRADLAALSGALAGVGFFPQEVSLEGQFDGRLQARTAEGGVEATTAAVVENFALASPRFAGKYSEPKITLDGSALVGFVDGKPDSIKRSAFGLVSKLGDLSGKLVAEKLATAPSFTCDLTVNTDLQRARDTLVAVGVLEEGARIGGKLKADITLASAGRAPAEKEARLHRRGGGPSAGDQPARALGSKEPAALAALPEAGPRVAGAAPEDPGAVVSSATVTGEGLTYEDIRIDRVNTDLQFKENKLTATGIAHLYQGDVTFSETSSLGEEIPAHEMKVAAREVLLTRELWEFLNGVIPMLPLPLGRIEGVFDADSKIIAQGTESEKLFATMNGEGTVTMPEDVRAVIPVFQRLPGLDKYSDLKFGRMNSVFTVKDGLSASETTFTAPDLTMKLTGTTNLVKRKVPDVEVPGREINYRVSLAGDRVGRDLRKLLSKKGELPIRITGTLQEPRAKLVLEGIFGPLEGLFD